MGMPVFVSSNCDTATGSGSPRVALLGHRDAAVLVEQQAVRSQIQYKQDFYKIKHSDLNLISI